MIGALLGGAALGLAGGLFGGKSSKPATPKLPDPGKLDEKQAKRQIKYNQKQSELNLRLLPQYGSAERALTDAQRTADFGYLSSQGAALGNLFGDVAPGYAAMNRQTSAIESDLQDAQARGLNNNNNALFATLQQQAQDDLALGGQLSEEEMRAAAQSARAGAAARGMATGNGSLFAEALNRDRFATARQGERRTFANNVIGTGLNMGQQQLANRGMLLNYANAQLSPIMTASYGNRSGVSLNAPSGSMAFAPRIQSGGDLYSTQLNAQTAAANSSANNRAAMMGAGINLLGDIGGAYLSNQNTGSGGFLSTLFKG